MSRFRHIAPAGAPIRLSDLARWGGAALAADPGARLREQVRARFGVRHAFLTSTGRAGMVLLLQAMHRLSAPGRDEVVLPTYTCYSVAASVLRAGLRPRLVDISPRTLDYAAGALAATDLSRVVAIVATSLYGVPCDVPAIRRLARPAGVFVVDDAAQAMGATLHGRPAGTLGDAGLFSLDKGKNVSAIDGGILVTDDDALAEALAGLVTPLPPPHLAEIASGVAKALVYAALLQPSLYWIPNRIPQLELGKTVFTTVFPLERPVRPLSALGCVMLGRLDAFTRDRVANARALRTALQGVAGLEYVEPIDGAEPVYLRLPVLVADAGARARVLAALQAAGIGATGSYPASLADVPELRPLLAGGAEAAAGGRDVASRIVTLPTHPFVSSADVARMAETIAGVLGSPARTTAPARHAAQTREQTVCAE